jgi:hypothetical protein
MAYNAGYNPQGIHPGGGGMGGGGMGGGGGGGGGSSGMGKNSGSTTTSSEPWGPAQPYLKGLMKRAGGYVNDKRGFNAPGFDTSVDMAPQTSQGLTGMMNVAQGGNPLAGASQESLMGILGSDPISPYARQLIDTEAGKLSGDISNQMSMGGNYGSAAHTGAIANQVGDFRNQMSSGLYQQGIGNQLAAVGAAPGAYAQNYAPYERMAGVGGAYEGQAASDLAARMQKFQTRQQAPWNRLNAGAGILNGTSQGYGTQTQTVQQPSNPWSTLAGAGLLGAGILGGNPGMGMSGFGMLNQNQGYY